MSKVKPISPLEVPLREFPDAVIEAFNELIIKNIVGNKAKVQQKHVLELISDKMCIPTDEVLDEKYLDIERNFEAAGWTVVYNKGAYYETFDPYFIFTKGLR